MNKKLYRVSSEGVIGGVCAGLARFLGIPTKLVRVIAILLLFFGFFLVTTIAYLVFMYFLEDAPASEATLHSKKPVKSMMNTAEMDFENSIKRLNDIERYVTSNAYEIDKQFRNLK